MNSHGWYPNKTTQISCNAKKLSLSITTDTRNESLLAFDRKEYQRLLGDEYGFGIVVLICSFTTYFIRKKCIEWSSLLDPLTRSVLDLFCMHIQYCDNALSWAMEWIGFSYDGCSSNSDGQPLRGEDMLPSRWKLLNLSSHHVANLHKPSWRHSQRFSFFHIMVCVKPH